MWEKYFKKQKKKLSKKQLQNIIKWLKIENNSKKCSKKGIKKLAKMTKNCQIKNVIKIVKK